MVDRGELMESLDDAVKANGWRFGG
jgi:hypothetical protein